MNSNDKIPENLQSAYDSIMGDEGKPTPPAKTDPAYAPPEFGGEDDDGKGYDPRDPSTFDQKEKGDEDGQDVPEEEDDDTVHPEVEEEADSDDEPDDSGDTEEIDPDQVAAARRRGYSDDEIVWLAENKPHILEDLTKLTQALTEATPREKGQIQEPDIEPEPEKRPRAEKIKIAVDALDIDDPVKNIITKLQESQNQLVDQLNGLTDQFENVNQQQQGLVAAQQSEYARQVDAYFDQLADEVPDLGQASSLTQSQAENRQRIHDDAAALAATGNYSIGEALSMMASAFQAQHGTAKTQEQIVRDLNKRKRKFTARPSHKKNRSDQAFQNLTPEQRALQVIEAKQKEYGWDVDN